MLGALPTAHERQLAGSAHSMTAMVEAEGITRRAPAALIGTWLVWRLLREEPVGSKTN